MEGESERKSGCWPRVAAVLRWMGVVAVLLVAALLHLEGGLLTLLNQLAFLLLPVGLVLRGWLAWRRTLPVGWLRRPLAKEHRALLLQALGRSVFWLLLGGTLWLALPAALFAPDEFQALLFIEGALIGLWVLLEWLPPRRVFLESNLLFAAGALLLAVELTRILQPPSGVVVLAPPFREEWNVFHGGRSSLVNHHYLVPGQRHALDLDRALDGPPKAGADKLESYAAWGAELLAPADGVVVQVRSGLPDNPIGKTDEVNLAGNHLVLQIGPGKYVLMAHLQRGSIRVKPGQRVREGEVLARCGNSGNTSEPHLHLQVQDRPEFGNQARTYPILFRGVRLRRGGRLLTGKPVDPRRNDRLVPLEP